MYIPRAGRRSKAKLRTSGPSALCELLLGKFGLGVALASLLLHVVVSVFCVVCRAVACVSVCGFASVCAILLCLLSVSPGSVGRDVHEISDAAAQDGCSNKSVIGLSKLGNRGRHLGNLYRALLRMTRRQHQHISVCDVDTVVKIPNATSQSLQMPLPHEWFSALNHRDRNVFDRVMGTDTCEEFWKRMAACDEPWLKHHQYRREVEAKPARRVPCRCSAMQTAWASSAD